jgi:hypothetical protein
MNAGTIIYVHFDIILLECTLTIFGWPIWRYLSCKKILAVLLRRPSPYLIKVLSSWPCNADFILDIYFCSENYIFVVVGFGHYVAMVENYVCRCHFVWIFVSQWWCMFGYNTFPLYIYVAGDALAMNFLYCCCYNVLWTIMMHSDNSSGNGQNSIARTNTMAAVTLPSLPPEGTPTACVGTYITNGWYAGSVLMFSS